MDNSTIGYVIFFSALAIGGIYLYNKNKDKIDAIKKII